MSRARVMTTPGDGGVTLVTCVETSYFHFSQPRLAAITLHHHSGRPSTLDPSSRWGANLLPDGNIMLSALTDARHSRSRNSLAHPSATSEKTLSVSMRPAEQSAGVRAGGFSLTRPHEGPRICMWLTHKPQSRDGRNAGFQNSLESACWRDGVNSGGQPYAGNPANDKTVITTLYRNGCNWDWMPLAGREAYRHRHLSRCPAPATDAPLACAGTLPAVWPLNAAQVCQ